MNNRSIVFVVFVCLPSLSFSQLLVDYLSEPRSRLCATANGGKVFFAGGWTTGGINSDAIDILDTVSFSWEQATLTVPRRQISAGSVGNKSYFIGGNDDTSMRNEMDIYDTATGQWTADSFPVARSLTEIAVSGTKLILAAGLTSRAPFIASDTVTILETATNTWSGNKLAAPAYRPGICEVNGKVIVSGGWNIDDSQGVYELNTVVNILDIASGTLEVQQMSVGITGQTNIGLNGKAYLIGGATLDSLALHSILVYDVALNSWEEIFAPNPHAVATTMVIGDKIFIAGGADIDANGFLYTVGHDVVDVYDTETATWESFVLTEPKFWGAGIGYGTRFYIAGGYDFETGAHSDIVNIYESEITFIEQIAANSLPVSVWPNPVTGDEFQVELPSKELVSDAFIMDANGHHFPVRQGQNAASAFASGVYFLVVKTPAGTAIRKFIKL
jgi:hypothetical protein